MFDVWDILCPFFLSAAQVNFTRETYVVSEGENDYVQVCIGLGDSVALDSSNGAATFTLTTTNSSG